MSRKRILIFLSVFLLIISIISTAFIGISAADSNFENQLALFPESYRNALRTLHSSYPNWKFIPDNYSLTVDDAVNLEIQRKLVSQNEYNSLFSMGPGAYDWAKGEYVPHDTNWYVASREVIKYYIDPRNFLNSNDIFMYMNLGYNASTQDEEGVKKIIKGTFLEKGYSDPNDNAYGGSYSKVIMSAASSSKVSPYYLAATIIQEQGTGGTSSLISGTYSGYEGYYNFFNVQATGSTTAAKIENGLKYAKNNGWNSRSASIIGGAQFSGNKYISVGQDTYFKMDFNLKDPDNIWHEYAGAVHDALGKGRNIAKNYTMLNDSALDFYIPVFTNMGDVAKMPERTTKRNNYYFNSISVSGLTPSFSRFNYEYNLRLTDNATVNVQLPSGASYGGAQSFNLKKGYNTVALKAKSETGYVTDYVINVLAEKDCTLYVDYGQGVNTQGGSSSSGSSSSGSSGSSSSGSSSSSSNPVLKGDVSGDGKVNGRDLANIQMHILSIKSLTGNNLKGADTNGDGKINGRDLANVQMHILGIKSLW